MTEVVSVVATADNNNNNTRVITKIGEIISASVLGGLTAKLEVDCPEQLRIGYPVIVEGRSHDFYCIVQNIVNQPLEIAERLAGATLSHESVLPRLEQPTKVYGQKVFYSKAELRPIQLISKSNSELSEPQTIPPYFAPVRHATESDVEKIYIKNENTSMIGYLQGISKFAVGIDLEKLTSTPFAIFGRTRSGKSIFNKILSLGILARNIASVLIFDMHGEYGTYSHTDNTPGLKHFFPSKVECLKLEHKKFVGGEKPFIIDPLKIEPSDLIVAMDDLTTAMRDALYILQREQKALERKCSLIELVYDEAVTERLLKQNAIHPETLRGLQRRLERVKRFEFVREIATGGQLQDAFYWIDGWLRDNKSIIIDFGKYKGDTMVYMFVANIITRRLYELYTEQRGKNYPRLVVFLEEAHKFLAPALASHTIFNRLARETRKFNLILALADQRPAQIDDDVRSQLANRFVLSLKEPSDISAALAGLPDRSLWERIIGTIPPRTVVVFGDAIRIPTVMEIMEYTPENINRLVLKSAVVADSSTTVEELKSISENVQDIFKS